MLATTVGELSDSHLAMSPRLDRVFVCFALVFGSILVALIPPFQSADETLHFFRAYQISEGTFVAQSGNDPGSLGGLLPASLYNIGKPFFHIAFYPSQKASLADIKKAMAIPLQPNDRIFLNFPNTAHYCPTCYLPQSVGIALGRLFGATPLAMMYLGREANLLVWTVLGFCSLRLAPAIARPLFLLLLMPTTLWCAASLSADTPTNSLAILFTAWICAQSNAIDKKLDLKSFGKLLAISVPLTLCKTAYVPMLGLLLLIPRSRFAQGRRMFAITLVVAINVAALIAWSSTSESLDIRLKPDPSVSPPAQLQYLQHNLAHIPALILKTIRMRGWTYIATFAATIGWYDMFLPAGVILTYLLVLLLACLGIDRARNLPSPKTTIPVVLLIAFLSTAIFATLDYLYWTPVGWDFIDGVSGRYFIPLAPAIILMLASVAGRAPQPRAIATARPYFNLVTVALALCMCIYFMVIVWGRYYGWIRAGPLF